MKTAIQKMRHLFPADMANLAAYIVGEVWTDNFYQEMIVNSDGVVVAKMSTGVTEEVGDYFELQNYWLNAIKRAGLSKQELSWAERRFNNMLSLTPNYAA